MPNSPETPEERYRKAWARMDRADRRRVLRAVNRMQPLDNPAEAALAVELAGRQRRMWMRWWWVLPAVGAAAAWPRGWEASLSNAVIGVVFVGIMAAAFSWRAGRSARINQEVVDAVRSKRRSGSPRKRQAAKKPGGRGGPRGGTRGGKKGRA